MYWRLHVIVLAYPEYNLNKRSGGKRQVANAATKCFEHRLLCKVQSISMPPMSRSTNLVPN
jgi:hypothetical protein